MIGKLTTALTAATTKPCNIVGVGSSTMQGYLQDDVEKRWFTRLVRAWQDERGGTDAVQYSTAGTFTERTTSGVHGYNLGEAGATSATYLTAAEITKINALDPAVVIHAIMSNDLATNVDPAVSKKNLLAKLDLFDAGTQHIFVHHHKRFDATFKHYWVEYLTKLQEIETEHSNVTVVNLAYEFEHEAGIPSGDWFRLVLPDKTHLTTEGHLLMAYLTHKAIGNS